MPEETADPGGKQQEQQQRENGMPILARCTSRTAKMPATMMNTFVTVFTGSAMNSSAWPVSQ
jgi:hypothetical protein